MSDNSYLRITVRTDYKDALAKRVFYFSTWEDAIRSSPHDADLSDEPEVPEGFTSGGFHEINIAQELFYDKNSACKLGMVFYGYMGPCYGAYGPMLFASDGSGLEFSCAAEDDGECPVVRILEDGTPDEAELSAARAYLQAKRRVTDQGRSTEGEKAVSPGIKRK